MKDKEASTQLPGEEACGNTKILCVYLGGATPQQFVLSVKGSCGAAKGLIGSERPGGRRPACQADEAVSCRGCQTRPLPAPYCPELLLSSPTEWRWRRRANRSISKVSDLYGSCSPVCCSECPCTMFNSWQTHAFSVMVAFMASHTILLVQPRPYKGIKKFLWCRYLSHSSGMTTSAMHTLTRRRRHQHDNNDLKSKLFPTAEPPSRAKLLCVVLFLLTFSKLQNFFTVMQSLSSSQWEKALKQFVQLSDIWDLSINPQQHTRRV